MQKYEKISFPQHRFFSTREIKSLELVEETVKKTLDKATKVYDKSNKAKYFDK